MKKTNDQWKQVLDPEVCRVTREKGTESPFSGELLHNNKTGVYTCSNCNAELFLSNAKFDSGCGWPSFYQPTTANSVEYHKDISLGMSRTEITCKYCGAHLGHVFPDGPQDKTGKRYCVNSLSLQFTENK